MFVRWKLEANPTTCYFHAFPLTLEHLHWTSKGEQETYTPLWNLRLFHLLRPLQSLFYCEWKFDRSSVLFPKR
jgi:hypothetical protein